MNSPQTDAAGQPAQHDPVRNASELIEALVDALHSALPIIEDAKHDVCYKPGAVAKVEQKIQDAIKRHKQQMAVAT